MRLLAAFGLVVVGSAVGLGVMLLGPFDPATGAVAGVGCAVPFAVAAGIVQR